MFSLPLERLIEDTEEKIKELSEVISAMPDDEKLLLQAKLSHLKLKKHKLVALSLLPPPQSVEQTVLTSIDCMIAETDLDIEIQTIRSSKKYRRTERRRLERNARGPYTRVNTSSVASPSTSSISSETKSAQKAQKITLQSVPLDLSTLSKSKTKSDKSTNTEPVYIVNAKDNDTEKVAATSSKKIFRHTERESSKKVTYMESNKESQKIVSPSSHVLPLDANLSPLGANISSFEVNWSLLGANLSPVRPVVASKSTTDIMSSTKYLCPANKNTSSNPSIQSKWFENTFSRVDFSDKPQLPQITEQAKITESQKPSSETRIIEKAQQRKCFENSFSKMDFSDKPPLPQVTEQAKTTESQKNSSEAKVIEEVAQQSKWFENTFTTMDFSDKPPLPQIVEQTKMTTSQKNSSNIKITEKPQKLNFFEDTFTTLDFSDKPPLSQIVEQAKINSQKSSTKAKIIEEVSQEKHRKSKKSDKVKTSEKSKQIEAYRPSTTNQEQNIRKDGTKIPKENKEVLNEATPKVPEVSQSHRHIVNLFQTYKKIYTPDKIKSIAKTPNNRQTLTGTNTTNSQNLPLNSNVKKSPEFSTNVLKNIDFKGSSNVAKSVISGPDSTKKIASKENQINSSNSSKNSCESLTKKAKKSHIHDKEVNKISKNGKESSKSKVSKMGKSCSKKTIQQKNSKPTSEGNVVHPMEKILKDERAVFYMNELVQQSMERNAMQTISQEDLVNGLFRDLMASKRIKLEAFSDSNKTASCRQCGWVREGHMCAYTIKKILEQC